MKKIKLIILLLISIVLISCNVEPVKKYVYDYTIGVTYLDGTNDTIMYSFVDYNYNGSAVGIKVTVPGTFSDTPIEPSLVITVRKGYVIVASGVRKYNLIEFKKTLK